MEIHHVFSILWVETTSLKIKILYCFSMHKILLRFTGGPQKKICSHMLRKMIRNYSSRCTTSQLAATTSWALRKVGFSCGCGLRFWCNWVTVSPITDTLVTIPSYSILGSIYFYISLRYYYCFWEGVSFNTVITAAEDNYVYASHIIF